MKTRWVLFFFTFAMMMLLASCAAEKAHKPDKAIASHKEKNPGEEGEDIESLEKIEKAKRHAEENIRRLKSALRSDNAGGLAIYEVYAASMAKNLKTLCEEHANKGNAKAVAWCCEHRHLTPAFCGKP